MFFKTSVSYGISSGTIKNNHLHFIVCVCFMADEPKKEAFPKGKLCFENLAWERHKRKNFSLQLQYLQIDRHNMQVNCIVNGCDDFMQYFMETFMNLLATLTPKICIIIFVLNTKYLQQYCCVNIEYKIMLKSCFEVCDVLLQVRHNGELYAPDLFKFEHLFQPTYDLRNQK